MSTIAVIVVLASSRLPLRGCNTAYVATTSSHLRVPEHGPELNLIAATQGRSAGPERFFA